MIEREGKSMRTVTRVLAFIMILVLLAGCEVKVNPTTTTTAKPTTTASTTTEATSTAAPTEVPISDFRFSSDPGSPNSRDELVKKWPEFTKDHTATIACFEWGWTGPVKEKDIVTPEIAKRTGFTIVYESITVNSEEEYNTVLNLMVSAGEIPEIYFGGADSYALDVYEKLGQAGQIYDMSKYLPKYAAIYNLLMPELTKFARSDTTGAHNWFIPTQTGRGFDATHQPADAPYIRKDFLDKLNLNWPKNMDELKTYLERCRDEITVNNQSVLPLDFDENLGSVNFMIEPFYRMDGIGFGFDWTDNFKPFNDQYTNSESLLRAMKYLNTLYNEGLIDEECLTIKADQIGAKVATGRVSALCMNIYQMTPLSDLALAEVPDVLYVAPPPLEDAQNPQIHRKWTSAINMYSTLIVSKKLDEETVNHFCALLDYLTGMDGQVLTQVGIPGLSFNIDSNGKYKFTDQFKKDTSDLEWNKVSAFGVYYWQQLAFNASAFVPLQSEIVEIIRKDQRLSWENNKIHLDLFDPNMAPPKDYLYIAGPVEKEKITALDNAYNQMVADCIIAKNSTEVESIVNAYAAQCKTLGIDEVMAERQQLIEKIQSPN
jgi:putative aldouronate transport system substrate-binding protein